MDLDRLNTSDSEKVKLKHVSTQNIGNIKSLMK